MTRIGDFFASLMCVGGGKKPKPHELEGNPVYEMPGGNVPPNTSHPPTVQSPAELGESQSAEASPTHPSFMQHTQNSRSRISDKHKTSDSSRPGWRPPGHT